MTADDWNRTVRQSLLIHKRWLLCSFLAEVKNKMDWNKFTHNLLIWELIVVPQFLTLFASQVSSKAEYESNFFYWELRIARDLTNISIVRSQVDSAVVLWGYWKMSAPQINYYILWVQVISYGMNFGSIKWVKGKIQKIQSILGTCGRKHAPSRPSFLISG